jgi:hypothetical protein
MFACVCICAHRPATSCFNAFCIQKLFMDIYVSTFKATKQEKEERKREIRIDRKRWHAANHSTVIEILLCTRRKKASRDVCVCHEELIFDAIIALRFLLSLHRFTSDVFHLISTDGRGCRSAATRGHGCSTCRCWTTFGCTYCLSNLLFDDLLIASGKVVVVKHSITARKDDTRVRVAGVT